MQFGHRLLRIGLLVWLLGAPGIGAVARYEQADTEWGLTPASRTSEMERGCRVDPIVVKGVSRTPARTFGGGPGLVANPSSGPAPGAHGAPASHATSVMADGRDTHLRLAVFLI